MCRYFTFWGKESRSVKHWLTGAENSLLQQSKLDNSRRPNPDGWGIIFQDNNAWREHRNTRPAFDDPNFIASAEDLSTPLILAHVRRKSQGLVQLENTHPFRQDNWVFMHNGNIPELDARKHELNAFLRNGNQIITRGNTDSEYLFHYILARLAELDVPDRQSLLNILKQVNRLLIENTPGEHQNMLALNFVLSDGQFLVSYRKNRPLSYALRPEGLVIASEPVDNGGDWTEIPDNHFILCQSPAEVEIIPAEAVEASIA